MPPKENKNHCTHSEYGPLVSGSAFIKLDVYVNVALRALSAIE